MEYRVNPGRHFLYQTVLAAGCSDVRICYLAQGYVYHSSGGDPPYCTSGQRAEVFDGRFNLLIDAIPQIEEWKRAGFQEVQTLAAQRWGILPKATCKNSTRNFFIFVSAELQARLCEAQVLDSRFPDHSRILATLKGADQVVPRLVWRTPRPT